MTSLHFICPQRELWWHVVIKLSVCLSVHQSVQTLVVSEAYLQSQIWSGDTYWFGVTVTTSGLISRKIATKATGLERTSHIQCTKNRIYKRATTLEISYLDMLMICPYHIPHSFQKASLNYGHCSWEILFTRIMYKQTDILTNEMIV